MSYEEDDWFSYRTEFNKRADSPRAAGNYDFESGNIDNIPLNDDGPLSPSQDFDLAGTLEEYESYDLRLSPNGGLNREDQQPGPSGNNDGQYHVMQNNDSFAQHMQSSNTIEYNSFEMPTVINSNHDVGPYQDLGIDDPNSFYANQQPSTSQGNDMIINENYEMMGPSTSYMPQIDHMNPSGNSSSQINHQQGMIVPQVQQQPAKPKTTKKRPPPKKKTAAQAPDTVGTVLTKVNKLTQQIDNNNDNQEQKIETRISAEDLVRVSALLSRLDVYQKEQAQGNNTHDQDIEALQAEIAQVFTKNMAMSANDAPGNSILSQIQNLTSIGSSASSSAQPSQPAKKAAPKRKTVPNTAKNLAQNQQIMPPQAQITPTKLVMDPPTTTMVPSSSQSNHMYSNDGFTTYNQMDEPGTSQQQQYNDYRQPPSQESMQYGHQQIIQARVVPSMNQKTHNYRQAVVFASPNTNGPSSQLQRPQSGMDQMQDQQYHAQDLQGSQVQQTFVSVQHDGQIYQEVEPTLRDFVRQGRYQGPQDAPHLRQQLITNVNATTNKQMVHRSQDPTPSPGNLQQFGEPLQRHGSYPHSHDMRPNSHSQSQHSYSNHYDGATEFFDESMQHQDSQMSQIQPGSQHYVQQQELYHPIGDQQQMVEPESEYPVPQVTNELSEEELRAIMEEKRQIRQKRLKDIMIDQLNRLEEPVDVTPFRNKMDVLERLLPYHHFANEEEPVSDFDSTFQRVMDNAVHQANSIGNRIRNIVLRDTMRSSTEWEENMILFLETESERRKLEDDKKLADQDLSTFLRNSDIIQNVRARRLDVERTRLRVPRIPAHLKELDLQNGQLSSLYREYEFDSYDENRPRGSPFVYEEPESESESEPEAEPEPKKDNFAEPEPARGDISPLIGFPQLSPIPSPSRYRNESESTFDWKDEDESPLLSPETEKINKAADQFRKEIFGTQEDLDKSEPFPFEQISEAARNQHLITAQPQLPRVDASSIGSLASSSSTVDHSPQSIHPVFSPKAAIQSSSVQVMKPPRSPSSVSCKLSTPCVEQSLPEESHYEGSPEIDEDYDMSPIRENEPAELISLPISVNMIKKEKEDSTPKLKLRIPAAVLQNGIVASEDESDVAVEETIPAIRKPLKLRFNLKDIKLEEPSPDRDVASSRPKSRTEPPPTPEKLHVKIKASPAETTPTKLQLKEKSPAKTPVFKTPLQTPIKMTPSPSESRKRRSAKIEDSPAQKKKLLNSGSSFVTPKNGLRAELDETVERPLRIMTDGRKIVMKISKVSRNINHFVTPRRDKKGNLHKDLSPTNYTRLTMKLMKKKGELSVEFTETPNKNSEEDDHKIPNIPSTSTSIPPASTVVSSVSVKGRPAPASRKSSIDTAGKDKKGQLAKNKAAFCNRFNPFANVPSSKPSTSSAVSATPSTSSAVSAKLPTGKTPGRPVALSTPRSSHKPPQAVVAPRPNLIRTAPVVPKITVTNASESSLPSKSHIPIEVKPKLSSLLPWVSDTDESPEQKHKLKKTMPSINLLKVKTEPPEADAVTSKPESPRASSSMSFFEDAFLRSPKRSNEPLPVVEFSDDEENDLAHSTFSHATDHLLGTSNMNSSTNGSSSGLPWSTDP